VESIRFSELGDGTLKVSMKVAFLNDRIYLYASSNPSFAGGNERQQWLLARALARSGWKVCVGSRNGSQSGECRIIEGVEFHDMKEGQYLLESYRFLSSTRPDWLYWRGASHLLGPMVQIAHSLGVQTIFAAAFDTDVHPRSALTRRQCWWPLYAWGLSMTERLFMQHGRQLEDLPSQWRAKALVVRSIAGKHGNFMPHSCREPYVAWVGMLRQPKRPDLLIEIAKRSPQVRYVVCGGATTHRSPLGYGEQVIDRLCGLANIEFHGQVSPEEAERIIGDAAVLLCTSDQEGFPNTFLQAWCHGTPVTTVQVDPDSIIKRLELGAVTSTVDATVDQLQRLLKSPEERQKIGARAREYIRSHHSEEVVVKAFDEATCRISG
jgi:glycosyltransferase involved in cell wall biosynthesis